MLEFKKPTYPTITHGQAHSKIDEVNRSISELTNENSREKIHNEVEKYIKNIYLRNFFMDHPTVWQDLLRELHSSLQENIGDRSLQVNPDDYDQIYSVFIVNGRTENIGKQLYDAIGQEIIHNSALLGFCYNKKSLLDSGSHFLSNIPEDNVHSSVQGFICRGMIDNIDGCTYENIDTYLPELLGKLSRYIPLVFGKRQDLYSEYENIRTLKELVGKLNFDICTPEYTKYGSRRVDIMRLIKAFHAWGNITEIEKEQKNAEEYAKPEHIGKLLKKSGIHLDMKTVRHIHGVYKGGVAIGGKQYEIQWRAKGLKSILHKLWETPEYTNVDALRDMLGITIICDDTTPEATIQEIIQKITQMMPRYGYVIKNKGLIRDREHLTDPRNYKKRPMYISQKTGDTTDPRLNNASVGGFTALDPLPPVGTEVQITKRSNFEWKKKDDAFYKAKGALNLLCRGEYFITPHRLYESFNALFSSDTLKNMGTAVGKNIRTVNDLIWVLIQTRSLFAYHHGGEIVFVPKKYQALFVSHNTEDYWTPVEEDNTKALYIYIQSIELNDFSDSFFSPPNF